MGEEEEGREGKRGEGEKQGPGFASLLPAPHLVHTHTPHHVHTPYPGSAAMPARMQRGPDTGVSGAD